MRIHKVPRAWLDYPGSIANGRPGPRGRSSVVAACNETIVRKVLEAFPQRVAVYRPSQGRITEIRVHQEPSGAPNS